MNKTKIKVGNGKIWALLPIQNPRYLYIGYITKNYTVLLSKEISVY